MDLYEITRTLVRRGCPEHPRLRYWSYPSGYCWHVGNANLGMKELVDDDARVIWTLWALEWALGLVRASKLCVARTPYVLNFIDAPGAERAAGKDILEAIEAATRHLEPTNGPT